MSDRGMREPHRLSFLLAIALSLAALAGCVITPVRTPTVYADSSGRHVPLAPSSGMVPGTTTRAEVEQKYQEFAIETGLQHFFWARVHKSSWAWAGFCFCAGGAAERYWSAYNLLVTFDDLGAVKEVKSVGDGGLFAELIKQEQPNAAGSAAFDGRRIPGNESFSLELSSAEAVVHTNKRTPTKENGAAFQRVEVRIPLQRLSNLRVYSTDEAKGVQIPLELQFGENTPIGSKVRFVLDAKDAVSLAAWMRKAAGR